MYELKRELFLSLALPLLFGLIAVEAVAVVVARRRQWTTKRTYWTCVTPAAVVAAAVAALSPWPWWATPLSVLFVVAVGTGLFWAALQRDR